MYEAVFGAVQNAFQAFRFDTTQTQYVCVCGQCNRSGVLALAQPAGARIIYTQIHKVIGKNSYSRIDLNHDGIVDFTIGNSAWRWSNASVNSIDVWPNHGDTSLVNGT